MIADPHILDLVDSSYSINPQSIFLFSSPSSNLFILLFLDPITSPSFLYKTVLSDEVILAMSLGFLVQNMSVSSKIDLDTEESAESIAHFSEFSFIPK